ncbi:unnamed protein product [Sphenostylis stenocarpa]|uniref:VQ domain-containing protein n=1 Tax=Sphenostylis stenocarpa TaxID=92480 RepID=A0AA86S760_9FABA|nr:unnamed protein product [Sphenostylis stenocarpa]
MSPKVQGALKINKESQTIKKSTSKAQQKEPLIIYTQSPRIIQTNSRHFMELVQKLTGIFRSDPDDTADADACKPTTPLLKEDSEENEEAASVITAEEDNCNISMGEVKSSFVALEPPLIPNYVNNFSVFESDFFSSTDPFLNFADPLLF